MRVLAFSLAMLLAGCASAPPAQPAENIDIEATVLAAYNVVSGPAGRRDWDRFKELFTEHAQIVVGDKTMTPDEFSKSMNGDLQTSGLFEHPVTTRIERAGNFAQVWTEYESRHATTDAQPFARGVRGFQLIRAGEQWRIASIVSQPQ
ncbi:MAG TPA: nuclear transport factor 2 family protein [Thermoanaerobaculia bacterium]|nr:nuclear transport factor 2 family protein [Thermoanaerobaculia bacterium]